MQKHFCHACEELPVMIFFIMVVGFLGAAPLFSSACRPATSVVITNNATTFGISSLVSIKQ